MKINHKPERYFAHIDGLRAIAVMSVVLHHLMPEFVPGGFIGVDVFFVISGYLITGILIREMESDKFSFLGFYERRARRIFPALFAVLLFTLLGSYILFLPSDFVNTLRGAFGTVFFISNIVFWRDLAEGYFAAMDGALNPLVHTWSLAVEEQFYVLFPILLLIFFKFKFNNFFLIFILIFFISLIGSEYFINTKSVAVFFLSPFRAWELIAGSILALGSLPVIRSRVLRDVCSLVGLSSIFFACFYFDKYTSFPGISALIPVLGSAAIIHSGMSGEGTIIKFIKFKPFIFVGLISYSLYLWHWPIIVFAKYLNPIETFSANIVIFLLLLSVFISTISYYVIEQPFRTKNVFSRKFIFSSSIFAMILFSLFTIQGIKMEGFKNRFTSKILAFDKARIPEVTSYRDCDDIINAENWCIIGDKFSDDSVLLFGDSHLLSWAPVLDKVLLKRKQKGIFAMQSNCPPIIDLEYWMARIGCAEKNQSVKKFISSNTKASQVIISGYWPAYFQHADELPIKVKGIKKNNEPHSIPHYGVANTIKWIMNMNKQVILIGPVPVYDKSVPMLLALNELNKKDYLKSNYDDQLIKSGSFNEIVDNYNDKKGFLYINPLKWLCDPNCITAVKEISIYHDSNHLNSYGANQFEKNYLEELQMMGIN